MSVWEGVHAVNASKKLTALAMDAPTIGLPEPMAPEIEPAVRVFVTLVNALPQIVAVVGAAEDVPELGEDNYLLTDLRDALAALEEALQ
jgi:hypothetical protein